MTTQVGVAGHIIKRPRLTKLLDETDARIILLCAPAGYGKTTLAREWVEGREDPVAWCDGSAEMIDPVALQYALAAALRKAGLIAESALFSPTHGSPPDETGRSMAEALRPDATGTLV